MFYLILSCCISLFSFHEFTCVYSLVTALSVTGHGVETERQNGLGMMVSCAQASYKLWGWDIRLGWGEGDLQCHLSTDFLIVPEWETMPNGSCYCSHISGILTG